MIGAKYANLSQSWYTLNNNHFYFVTLSLLLEQTNEHLIQGALIIVLLDIGWTEAAGINIITYVSYVIMFVLLQSMAVNMGSISSWAGAHEKVSHVMSHCVQKCHTCVVIAWLFVWYFQSWCDVTWLCHINSIKPSLTPLG